MVADERWRAALLRPVSLAVVGASDDAAKTAGRPLTYLRRSGWPGRIYPVNPRRESVQGERAWPSVRSLPETPEHALILTGADQVRAAVIDCAAAGVKVASILAAGFAEVGPEGLALQNELVDIARSTGMRLLGPSSLGYVNPREGLYLSANAAFAEPAPGGGRLFAASQSGSLIGALASRGAAKGVAFAGLISVGVEADLTLGEICSAALQEPDVDAFLLFLETLRNAEDLARFALAAAAAGKPVIAYKLGRSLQAAEMAQSHTGAMAGEDAVADAFFQAHGIARVDTLDGLLEAPELARRVAAQRTASGSRVGVVTTTGGGAAMVVDQLGVRGVAVVPPSDATWRRLADAGVAAERGRVVDLTMAGARYEVMKSALDVLASAPEFDLLVVVVGSSARAQPAASVKPIRDSISPSSTPLAVFLSPEAGAAAALLAADHIPAFRTPESCADAIAACLRRRAPAAGKAPGPAPSDKSATLLDEASGYERLQAVGVRAAPYAVIPAEAAGEMAVAYPVAVKLLSDVVAHKTDIGGVVLGVRDREELQAAARAVVRSVRAARPDVAPDRLLVQAMVQGVGEVLVGLRRDPDVGPVILLAPGGLLAELTEARSLRLAPVDEIEAREMIDQLPLLKVLDGYRGRPRGDLAALCKAIAGVSRLGLEADILEAEINPLVVLPEGQGVVAVDALIRTRKPVERG